MSNVLNAMYSKFGVRKTNIVVTIAVSAFASIGVISAIGTAYVAGHIDGSQEMSSWFLEHGAELYEKDKEDDCDE